MCKKNHNRLIVRKTLHKLPAESSFFSPQSPALSANIAKHILFTEVGIEIRLKCRPNALFYEIFLYRKRDFCVVTAEKEKKCIFFSFTTTQCGREKRNSSRKI